MFQNIDQIKQYVNVSSQLDIHLLTPYLEEALRVRIYPYIPQSVCQQISNEPYGELLKKSVANYTMAYAIPFLKVHWSNTGANYFSDAKTEKASWWDLRDWGLSAIAIADRALNSTMMHLYNSSYKTQIPLLNGDTIFQGLWEFEKYYSLTHSWEVYTKLLPVIERVWDLRIAPQVVCSKDQLRSFEPIWQTLLSATALFVVAEMIQLRGVSFTYGAMCIQWEELPWQQSKLLNSNELDHLYQEMSLRADAYLHKTLQMIRIQRENNPHTLSCFSEQQTHKQIITKKSGLYL